MGYIRNEMQRKQAGIFIHNFFFRQHLIDAKSLSIFKCDSCVIRLLYSIYVRVHIYGGG